MGEWTQYRANGPLAKVPAVWGQVRAKTLVTAPTLADPPSILGFELGESKVSVLVIASECESR